MRYNMIVISKQLLKSFVKDRTNIGAGHKLDLEIPEKVPIAIICQQTEVIIDYDNMNRAWFLVSQ